MGNAINNFSGGYETALHDLHVAWLKESHEGEMQEEFHLEGGFILSGPSRSIWNCLSRM